MDNKKQYYNNLKPGDTSIESRLGAKILMNDNLVINASRRSEYLDQLREDEYQGNINPNADEETSIVFMGKIPVDINQQGNINQESILENRESTITTPNRTPGEMPDEEQFDPPTITNVTPLEGRKGDAIIIEGTGFINNSTQVYFGGVLADSVDFASPTKIIAYVGNGNSGDIIVKASGISSAPYKDKFNYLGIEEGVMFEEVADDPTDASIEGDKLADGEQSEDEKNDTKIPGGCPKPNQTRSKANVVRVITPCEKRTPFQGVARDNTGKIIPIYDFVAAAKTCINISTSCPAITENGVLGCGMALSIMYMYACGHGMTWISSKKNKNPIIGTHLQYVYGTASIYDYLSKDKLNFEKIKIYEPGQGRDYWNKVSVKLLQPGDIIDTVTDTVNGHIGIVSDTQTKSPGTWDIISNSSRGFNPELNKKIGSILLNYSGYHGGNGFGGKYRIATTSGVGSTYLFRFKCGRGAEWGKTIGIPQK